MNPICWDPLLNGIVVFVRLPRIVQGEVIGRGSEAESVADSAWNRVGDELIGIKISGTLCLSNEDDIDGMQD